MPKYSSIGKIVSVFGLQGEMLLRHSLGKRTALKGLETLFIEEKKNELLPYFIQEARPKDPETLYLKLEGIDTREVAQKFLQKSVWLIQEDFDKQISRSAPISLLGFELIDDGKSLGEILEIIEQPHQLLCRIDLEGKEALIPIHENLLKEIDKRKKQVHVLLPEGLLDIYR